MIKRAFIILGVIALLSSTCWGAMTEWGWLSFDASHNRTSIQVAALGEVGYMQFDSKTSRTKVFLDPALIGGTGTGDMLKSVYDTNNDGIVNLADNSDMVDGLHASAFSLTGHVHAAGDITSGQLAAALGGTAADSSASTGVPKVAAGTWTFDATYSDVGAQPLTTNLTNLGALAPAGHTNYIFGINDTADGVELKNTIAVSTVNLAAVTDYQVGAVQLGQVAETLKNKTLSTGVKLPGSALLTHPTVFAAGVVQQTTVTSRLYGQAKFADELDKATNYIEYKWRVPDDYDNTVDPVGTFSFALGAADISPQVYAISVATIPASASYDTAPAHEVEMVYAGDAAGADKDMEYTNAATLTDWHDDLVASQTCWIRVARDGDHASDTSIVDSYSMELNIKYGRVLP